MSEEAIQQQEPELDANPLMEEELKARQKTDLYLLQQYEQETLMIEKRDEAKTKAKQLRGAAKVEENNARQFSRAILLARQRIANRKKRILREWMAEKASELRASLGIRKPISKKPRSRTPKDAVKEPCEKCRRDRVLYQHPEGRWCGGCINLFNVRERQKKGERICDKCHRFEELCRCGENAEATEGNRDAAV